ncbi:hypothetical protein K1719_003772 [Acacia pycnantha]|nr:hypothetical protein K1719_003772 [Acacia pycnantha]
MKFRNSKFKILLLLLCSRYSRSVIVFSQLWSFFAQKSFLGSNLGHYPRVRDLKGKASKQAVCSVPVEVWNNTINARDKTTALIIGRHCNLVICFTTLQSRNHKQVDVGFDNAFAGDDGYCGF